MNIAASPAYLHNNILLVFTFDQGFRHYFFLLWIGSAYYFSRHLYLRVHCFALNYLECPKREPSRMRRCKGWIDSLACIISQLWVYTSYSCDSILFNPLQNRQMASHHVWMLEHIKKIAIFTLISTVSGDKSQGKSARVFDSKVKCLPFTPHTSCPFVIYWWALKTANLPNPEHLRSGCAEIPQGILLQCSSEVWSMSLFSQIQAAQTHLVCDLASWTKVSGDLSLKEAWC